MDTVEIGKTYAFEIKVEKEHSASHIGSGSIAVLSTPSMILFMEMAAKRLMDDVLEPPMSTVGTLVNITHNKAIAVGKVVRSEAILKEVDRKKLIFDVKVTCGDILVGKGEHHRYIIDENKFLQSIG
ncbi:MAG: hypothetical protein INQ03_13645 [Candidatus Heimdallarchaeota archaeon]|nr:hypothetical protein [Candidatus Heimdallarchaeota archaeon]